MQKFTHKYIYLCVYIIYMIKTMAHVCMIFLFLFFLIFKNILGLQN